jgi:F0F1-type ATP synthase delta subunit
MDLFLEAATVDKNAAKAILRIAKKADTGEAWENAISELESIIG